ncbi:DUF624 domain-containing protein [Ruania alkalisoli]|uniref:DUF624 domain-containing protein n=1 Tax=Ruania alkalisoli TaxID=2779775 RepID=A0A7M1SY45_9MICO|nr:DUF624 domain-containing protein [Ruania alkalisoli]QOR71543.1 DUF624 domain-containing protein [Ruania alkalisoli]
MATGDYGRGSSSPGLIELVTTWVCRLVALSLTWLAQVLAGAVIAGIAPATLTLYHQVRLGLDDQVLPGYYRRSWHYWRRHFLAAQKHLLLPLVTVVVLLFYLRLAAGTPVAAPVTVVSAVYLAWLMMLPAWMIADGVPHAGQMHVTTSWGRAWQLVAIGALPCLVAAAVAAGATALLIWYLPVVVPLVAPAGIATLASIAAQRAMERARRLGRTH